MPLKLTLPQDEIATREVLGLRIPVFRSYEEVPIGLRVAFADLLRDIARGRIGESEATLRLLELLLRWSPDPADRLTYEELARLRLTEEEAAALMDAVTEATRPLWDRALGRRGSGEGEERREPEPEEVARGN